MTFYNQWCTSNIWNGKTDVQFLNGHTCTEIWNNPSWHDLWYNMTGKQYYNKSPQFPGGHNIIKFRYINVRVFLQSLFRYFTSFMCSRFGEYITLGSDVIKSFEKIEYYQLCPSGCSSTYMYNYHRGWGKSTSIRRYIDKCQLKVNTPLFQSNQVHSPPIFIHVSATKPLIPNVFILRQAILYGLSRVNKTLNYKYIMRIYIFYPGELLVIWINWWHFDIFFQWYILSLL